jgi:Zn-dependent peptidase ImmA (M78 family)
MNVKDIRLRVDSILKDVTELVLPIRIEDIAKMRGLTIMPYPLGDDVSGLLSIENGKGTIGYNENEPKVRRRFTIAHELGHYELHRHKSHLFLDKQFIYRSQVSGANPVTQAMEKEANLFASIILMPTDLVRKEVDKIQIDLSSGQAINDLAKIFEVSATAMSVRLSNLGLIGEY